MDILLASLFERTGHLVAFFGGGLALLLIGMSPLYIAAYYFFVKQVALRSSMLLYGLLIASALMMSSIIGISAMVMGQWG